MMKIDTRNWKKFIIGKLFQISRPKARSQAKYIDGKVPFVSSGNYNNGVVKYCEPMKNEQLDKGSCITVSPLDGSTFYQPHDFLGRGGAGSSILILRNENLNELNGLYLSSILRATLTKYSYSNQLSSEIIEYETIKLPVDDNEEIDWLYMENYMKSIMKESEIIIDQLKQIEDEKRGIDISGWKRFHLYDEKLFDIDMGTKLDKSKMTEISPSVNFVGRGNNNNGISGRVDKIPNYKPYEAGNMTLSLGGEVGSCFIQPDMFYTSQNVVVLIPRWEMPFAVKLFISVMIFRESQTYYKAFINELNKHIKTDFSFYLPVDAKGNPDWSFMKTYMQDIISYSDYYLKSILFMDEVYPGKNLATSEA